jgi:hypothetical protein
MIKKLIVAFTVILLIAAAGAAHAVEWTVANQSTIAWDAVTITAQGNTIPSDDIVKYQVYIVKEGALKGTAIPSGTEIETLQHTITFTEEGRWLAGVQSIRAPAESPADVQKSGITWSDAIDVTAVPVPFGFIFFEAPANVKGLGPQ